MRALGLLAAVSVLACGVAAAQTVPTKPSDHGLFDSAANIPPDASGLVTLGTLSLKLQGFLPLSGGTLSGSVTAPTISVTCVPTATLKAMTVPNGTIGCVNDLAGSNGSTYSNIVFYINGAWEQSSWSGTL